MRLDQRQILDLKSTISNLKSTINNPSSLDTRDILREDKTMRIYGIDFTSAPSRRKPLVCAIGELQGGLLQVSGMETWTSYAPFETFLAQPGPWTAGLDFPFGFPRAFLEAQILPNNWEAYIASLERFFTTDHRQDRQRYRAWIKAFRDRQPPGDKHPKRAADRQAGALSPLMVVGVPVGMMLLEGATRLRRAGVQVLPCRRNSDTRVVLEAYPGLAAARLLGARRAYKSESRPTDAQRQVRAALLHALENHAGEYYGGLGVRLVESVVARCLDDRAGDHLDAVLCAVQAAWAASQRAAGWGLPADAPAAEGWIVDPAMQSLAGGDARDKNPSSG